MDQSENLQLPYIMPSQAQKHVTHNEAIRALDALVQLAVIDRDLSAPPGSPADGARYLVASGGSSAWSGKDGQVAAWQDGAWAFLQPRTGWLAWLVDEARLLRFDGAAWGDAAVSSVNPAPLIGVNATADATNRLAVKSPASLFDHAGDSHRMKINKAAAGDTAAMLFQTGYSGRAEFGLTGDDNWHVKVSPDGSIWTEALRVDASTGRITLPPALALGDDNQLVARMHIRERLAANRTYYVRSDGSDSNNGLANTSGGAFLTAQKALDAVSALDCSIYDATIQLGAGTRTAAMTWRGHVGSGTVTLLGDTTTPANVLFSTTSATCLTLAPFSRLTISGMKLQTTTGGDCVRLSPFSQLRIGAGINFGPCAGAHIACYHGNVANTDNAYTISGGAMRHLSLIGACFVEYASFTLTLSGTPAWSNAFIYATSGAQVTMQSVTMSGAATGKRYELTFNAGLNSFGAGSASTYFPGNANGTTASGAQQG